jgi:hypothetical protein
MSVFWGKGMLVNYPAALEASNLLAVEGLFLPLLAATE